MRFVAIAVGLAFAISTMPVLSPAWAQQGNPGAPIGGGGSGGGNPGYPDPMVNSFGKCWISTDANPRWGDCPHAAPKGGHHKKG
jgi:hypothetical protein